MHIRLACIFLLTSPISAPLIGQESSGLVKANEEILSRNRNSAIFDQGGANESLIGGGAYYVTNPAPAYEMNTKLAYLKEEFNPLSVLLVGKTDPDTLNGRLRLVDQKFEVIVEGRAFELDNRQYVSVTDATGAKFIPTVDLLGREKGVKIYQELYRADGGATLYHHRYAEWLEPKKKNMFDTREPVKKLKRREKFLLYHEGISKEVNNLRGLAQLLGLNKKDDRLKRIRDRKDASDAEAYVALMQAISEGNR